MSAFSQSAALPLAVFLVVQATDNSGILLI
jgi:hypothetical protein